MKKLKKRLVLTRETLNQLEGGRLPKVAGQVLPPPTVLNCNLTIFTTRPVGCGIYSESCESVCICDF